MTDGAPGVDVAFQVERWEFLGDGLAFGGALSRDDVQAGTAKPSPGRQFFTVLLRTVALDGVSAVEEAGSERDAAPDGILECLYTRTEVGQLELALCQVVG